MLRNGSALAEVMVSAHILVKGGRALVAVWLNVGRNPGPRDGDRPMMRGLSGAVVESDLVAVGVGEGEGPTEGPSIGAETMVWLSATRASWMAWTSVAWSQIAAPIPG